MQSRWKIAFYFHEKRKEAKTRKKLPFMQNRIIALCMKLLMKSLSREWQNMQRNPPSCCEINKSTPKFGD